MVAKEGAEVKCEICGGQFVKVDKFWTIVKHEKFVPTIPCQVCGKPFTIEERMERDEYEIDKSCSCKTTITREAIEAAAPQWKKKVYFYCDDCFRSAFANFKFAELGDDNG